jgi:hypothetical protein
MILDSINIHATRPKIAKKPTRYAGYLVNSLPCGTKSLSVKLSNRFANQSGNPSTTLTLRLGLILEATHSVPV